MTEDKAREIAHGLIQSYIGPDHKVIDMKAFYSALVQALRDAGLQQAHGTDTHGPYGLLRSDGERGRT